MSELRVGGLAVPAEWSLYDPGRVPPKSLSFWSPVSQSIQVGFRFLLLLGSEKGSPAGASLQSRDPERRGRCAGGGGRGPEPQETEGRSGGGGGGVRGPPPAPPDDFAAWLSCVLRVVAALLLGPCIQPGRSSSGARGCAGLRGAWEPTHQGHAPLSDAGQGPVGPP